MATWLRGRGGSGGSAGARCPKCRAKGSATKASASAGRAFSELADRQAAMQARTCCTQPAT
eukprot:11444247-Alexandrium_andersonii.AAC.1